MTRRPIWPLATVFVLLALAACTASEPAPTPAVPPSVTQQPAFIYLYSDP